MGGALPCSPAPSLTDAYLRGNRAARCCLFPFSSSRKLRQSRAGWGLVGTATHSLLQVSGWWCPEGGAPPWGPLLSGCLDSHSLGPATSRGSLVSVTLSLLSFWGSPGRTPSEFFLRFQMPAVLWLPAQGPVGAESPGLSPLCLLS